MKQPLVMKKPLVILAAMYAALVLTACNDQRPAQLDANGQPVPQAQSHSDNSWIWGAGLGYLLGRMSAPSAAPAVGYAPQAQPHYQPTPQPERRSWWQRSEQPRAAVTTPSLPSAAAVKPVTPAAPSVIPNFAKPSVPNGYQAPTITMKPSTGLAAPAAPAPKPAAPSMPSYSAPARSYSSTPSYSSPSRSYSSPSYSSGRR